MARWSVNLAARWLRFASHLKAHALGSWPRVSLLLNGDNPLLPSHVKSN
eukprot:CAMPEP_0171103894 /NCGR_PEP_ID=MMETSP0766_2-20121228/59605_1 /TAXON_ID=439317 /ORGANISM="Gambierdiscus australes, Strain CAWD 149" /LENGTH=48 /DNA_ID= /DNA_START= /DNA_END= /DNA_ORIENTATION=